MAKELELVRNALECHRNRVQIVITDGENQGFPHEHPVEFWVAPYHKGLYEARALQILLELLIPEPDGMRLSSLTISGFSGGMEEKDRMFFMGSFRLKEQIGKEERHRQIFLTAEDLLEKDRCLLKPRFIDGKEKVDESITFYREIIVRLYPDTNLTQAAYNISALRGMMPWWWVRRSAIESGAIRARPFEKRRLQNRRLSSDKR